MPYYPETRRLLVQVSPLPMRDEQFFRQIRAHDEESGTKLSFFASSATVSTMDVVVFESPSPNRVGCAHQIFAPQIDPPTDSGTRAS
jgi:hypothetical protein